MPFAANHTHYLNLSFRQPEQRSRGLCSILLCGAVLVGAAAPLPAAAASSASRGSSGKTIGLVLTDMRYALRETPGAKEECAGGLQANEIAQFKATPGHFEHMHKFGGNTQNRGPNGELANYIPLMVQDPLPWAEMTAKVGYGVNLDGTQDGRATAKSLAHEKLTDPVTGEKVDNQMARVLGCVQGWRKTGFMAEFYSKEVETSSYNRMLIEISGVDDERNDPRVEVAIYKGLDRIVRNAAGTSFIPMMSQRVDTRFPEFVYRTRGKIVVGEVRTDPLPLARMALIQVQIPAERRMHDMTLRLKLTADGAEGIMAGYEDLDAWWHVNSKIPGSDVGRYSPAIVYKAALRFADGYPDPATGKATAISAAYKITAVRALIVHGASGRSQVATAR